MKKFLLLMLMTFCVGISSMEAQVYYFRTTSFAYKQVNDYGYWTNWTDWESSDMLITMNLNSDVVRIYSPQTQTYRITQHVRNFTDNSGGKQVEFRFIDQDNDRGSMRLRIESNGNSQIYVEFKNVMWVYNVVRTQ